jgi:hypothetical protein
MGRGRGRRALSRAEGKSVVGGEEKAWKESTDIDKKTDKILAGAEGRFWEGEEKLNRERKGA